MHQCIRFRCKGIAVDEFSGWNSRKGNMGKELFMHLLTKTELFKVYMLVWRQSDIQTKERE